MQIGESSGSKGFLSPLVVPRVSLGLGSGSHESGPFLLPKATQNPHPQRD